MKSTHMHFYLFLFLFLFPYKSTFAQENIVSDSLEVILPDSVELGDNGFHEVVNEKFIEGESFWEGFGSLHVFILASGIFFWVALILFLVFKLFRYFFK
ncbi:hypothetical protein [Mariniradius sediminis]|uniref:PepSY-associated TM region n=1 Tax=Mariniradius sediminis TaxID=2909237 RepID=A0ABS9BWB7_9BACT|nr:hypothetical protein [Mariniradius sediminis]MCF1751610.1 hypothetical protein [Mariniradius sediminis]